MIKKIAVFRALYLGDMLCIIPTIRAFRTAFPNASITLVGLPWQEDFCRRFAHYFDDFIAFPGWPGLPEQEVNGSDIIPFLQQIRSEKFDLVLQMQGNGFITNNMVKLWGARTTCGLRRQDSSVLNEKLFPVSEDDEHEVLRFLKLADAIGIERTGTDLEFPILADEIGFARHITNEFRLTEKEFVCIHPGARDPKRRWPAEKFAFIADRISEQGVQILLTGSASELELLQQVQSLTKLPVANLVSAYGDVSIGILAALINSAGMMVSNDTGVSHVATALKTPSVIIFSPYSDIRRWAPLDQQLHASISAEKSDDPEYVWQRIQDHPKSALNSTLFLNQK